MEFTDYIRLRKVVKARKDEELALSLLETARNELKMLSGIDTGPNPSFHFKNVYDCMRSCFEALLAKEGFKSYSHEATIQFVAEKGIFTTDQISLFDNFRKKRHDIQYRGLPIKSEDYSLLLIQVDQVFKTIDGELKR